MVWRPHAFSVAGSGFCALFQPYKWPLRPCFHEGGYLGVTHRFCLMSFGVSGQLCPWVVTFW